MIDKKYLRMSMLFFGGTGYDLIRQNEFVKEMRTISSAKVLPVLAELFSDPDIDIRANSLTAILMIDNKLGLNFVLPHLNDPDVHIRYHICGLMNEFGDERAVDPLLDILKNDLDPDIRGRAAYGLGGIGDVNAIAALAHTEKIDHEPDSQDYVPSQSARQAIHQILLGQVIAHLITNSSVKIEIPYPNGGFLKGKIAYLIDPINWGKIQQDLPKKTFEYTQSLQIQAKSLHPLPLLTEVRYSFAEVHARRKFVFTNGDKQWSIGIYMSPESSEYSS